MRIQDCGDIVFNKVNFTYPTGKDVQVLHDVSFEVRRGSCTAILGSSGSGKSTVGSVLLKLYHGDYTPFRQNDGPDLSIGGTDIILLHTSSLRSKMAIVSQLPVLYPGTIAENIAYGLEPLSPLASTENVRAAADAAGVSEFVDSLPNAYNTLVGEGGTGSSGGQAQRLSFACALVRQPNILILDEATSALDVESASVVRDTIKNLIRTSNATPKAVEANAGLQRKRSGDVWDSWKGKESRREMTVVIITHARETMAIAEHVVMLDKRRFVEQGGFREFKRRNGKFAKLLRGQGE